MFAPVLRCGEVDSRAIGRFRSQLHRLKTTQISHCEKLYVVCERVTLPGGEPGAFPHHWHMQAFADVEGITVLSNKLPPIRANHDSTSSPTTSANVTSHKFTTSPRGIYSPDGNWLV